ncbi:transcriptional regulator [Betaproteobacteria bacterium]|nr:transcriptional regulator [Betaproteobacteria bacterium]GHU00448.1 transcriptional regulator [Betaproteobacteria bacterium]GHU18245.1 transcriptional regulator [Betaproteobacteria bacterium]
MGKFETLDVLLRENNGFLKTSDATGAGISRPYFGAYVRGRGLERIAHGLYMSQDAWDDGMYVIQTRYPAAVFSHETALYLLNLAEREPVKYSLTLKAETNATRLTKQGVKVYKIKETLLGEGVMDVMSPAGHLLRVYNPERTICDLVRSRKNIEIQNLQTALREYMRLKGKNIPQLMRYAKSFSIDRIIRQYLEVLL